MNFTRFIFIFKIISIVLLPSDEIWNQTLQYIDEGLMYNFNKAFYIWWRKFYCLRYWWWKNEGLYNKQEIIFKTYGIATYIFAVSYINESIEEIGSIRNNTRDNLRNNGYYVDNSIFTVFSIDSINGLIYTGKIIKNSYISNDNAKYMKEKIINNLENENYYNAWDDFLNDIIDFCNRTDNNNNFNYFNNNKTYNVKYTEQGNSNNIVLPILAALGLLIFFGIFIYLIECWKKCDKYTHNNDNSNYDFNQSFGGISGNSVYSGGNNGCSGGNGGCSGGNSGYNGGNSGCSGGA